MINNILTPKPIKENNLKNNLDILSCVPKEMGDYIRHGCGNKGINKSICLASTLCGIAGLVGKRVSIISPNGYKIFPSLYSMNIAPSGSNKSSSINYALDKIEDINQDRIDNYVVRLNKYHLKMKEYASQPKGQKGSPPIKPMGNYPLMGSYTWQALVSGLSYKNKHGVLIRNDEIESLLDRVTGNKNQDEKSLLLSALTNGSFSKETKMEEVPENINKLCLSIIGSIQDDVADKYYSKDDGSGVLARFQLFTYSVSKFIPMKSGIDSSINNAIINTHNSKIVKISNIRDIYTPNIGVINSIGDTEIRLNNEASNMIIDFFNNYIRNEELLHNKSIIQEYIRKMIYTVQSITLCLHIYEHGTSNIIANERTVKNAISLTKYFYNMFVNFIEQDLNKISINDEIKRIRKYYKSMKLNSEGYFTLGIYFNKRRLVRGASCINTSNEAEELLELLVDNSLLDKLFIKGKAMYKPFISSVK